MAVSEVAVKYGVKGARAARRADQKVRESIQRTAKTAREESGVIERSLGELGRQAPSA